MRLFFGVFEVFHEFLKLSAEKILKSDKEFERFPRENGVKL
jgi:hypothetical protein